MGGDVGRERPVCVSERETVRATECVFEQANRESDRLPDMNENKIESSAAISH